MARAPRTPVPGTVGDPAASPRGQAGGAPASASSDPLVQLLIGKAKASGIDDPNLGTLSAALVHEIDLQCNDLLQYHRTIANGIENAGNQVRDMRIQWSELGPEPSFVDTIVELLIVSFVVMPLMSKAVGLAFRFVDEIAPEIAMVQQWRVQAELKAFQALAQKGAPLNAEIAAQQAALRRAEALLARADQSLAPRLPIMTGQYRIPRTVTAADAGDLALRLEREIEDRQARIAQLSLQQAEQALALQKSQPTRKPLDPEAIRDFFDRYRQQLQEKTLPGSGLRFAQARTATAVREAPPSGAVKPTKGQATAASSPTVQIESLAQTFLRSMERYFDNMKANAQAVFNIATVQPAMAVPAFAVLAKMHGVLSGREQVLEDQFATPEQLSELKQRVALDTEHKIWAMLIGDKYKQYLWTDFDTIGAAELVTMVRSWLVAPPHSVIVYLRERFYEGDERINHLRILYDLERIRKDFLEINKDALAGQVPIEEKEFVLPTAKAN